MSGILRVKTLSLRAADEIATLAIEACELNKFNPISICVMDPAGHPIVTKRMDGCPAMAYPAISLAKANTCVSVKSSSRAYGAKYLKPSESGEKVGPETFARVLNQITTLGGKAAAFQGGILLMDKTDSQIVGSVGVSGAAGDEDEYCALRGVWDCSIANELTTSPSEHSCKTVKDTKR
eukprot:CAMPEP_0198295120 /NCGR_PEP_ID=MMETSP1449-20131203/25965_1 /TAXON_ID=420275 /ORGANISM="Attheya septentrionalis, Strain CCMP2084" /LENGTH=178 /DNA_ID=CAMNT_0043995315 /DNA_START=56 /DNA_END=592 /DNA_ORIENTATION=+